MPWGPLPIPLYHINFRDMIVWLAQVTMRALTQQPASIPLQPLVRSCLTAVCVHTLAVAMF